MLSLHARNLCSEWALSNYMFDSLMLFSSVAVGRSLTPFIDKLSTSTTSASNRLRLDQFLLQGTSKLGQQLLTLGSLFPTGPTCVCHSFVHSC